METIPSSLTVFLYSTSARHFWKGLLVNFFNLDGDEGLIIFGVVTSVINDMRAGKFDENLVI